MRCIYGVFGREITKYTVIYGAYIRFWPTLRIAHVLVATLCAHFAHTTFITHSTRAGGNSVCPLCTYYFNNA